MRGVRPHVSARKALQRGRVRGWAPAAELVHEHALRRRPRRDDDVPHGDRGVPDNARRTTATSSRPTWSDGGSFEQIHVNATDGGSAGALTWGTDDTLQEPGASPYIPYADSWSATDTYYDGGVGLELFVALAHDAGTETYDYLTVAGATPAHVHSPASWDHPGVPMPDDAGLTLHYDGPSAVFDNSAGRFWSVVTADGASHNPRVFWTAANCADFPADCTAHAETLTQASGVNNGSLNSGGSHFTIMTHPSTTSALIAFHDASDRIRLLVVEPHVPLIILNAILVDSSAPYDANTNCPLYTGGTADCASSAGGDVCKCRGVATTFKDCSYGGTSNACVRLGGKKVHVLGRYDDSDPMNPKYLALVSYDSSFTDNLGNTRFTSHVAVVDLGATPPAVIASYYFAVSNGEQTWNGTVGGGGTNHAGLFYYYNANDPCSTYFSADVSPNNFQSETGLESGVLASGFPVIYTNRSSGMGDYVGAVRAGLASGHLFATFGLPVATSATCLACDGGNLSQKTAGAEITP